MDRKIHDVLDDLGSLDDLACAERRAALDLARTLDAVGALVREVPSPDLTEQVMRRIGSHSHRPPESGAARLLSLLQWLWRPRSFAVALRPATALAALAICLTVAFAIASREPTGFEVASADMTAPPIYVQFRLEHSNATRVSVVGSFTDWEPVYEMEQTSPGVWSIMLPLQPGVYDYAFLVDGEQWIADPTSLQVDDGFGGVNSRIALPGPSSLHS